MTFFFFILLSTSNSGCSIDPCWCLGQMYLTSLRIRQKEGDEEEGCVGAVNTDLLFPSPPT